MTAVGDPSLGQCASTESLTVLHHINDSCPFLRASDRSALCQLLTYYLQYIMRLILALNSIL